MTELVVGIKHIRDDVQPQATIGAEMSVVGLIGTAPGADSTFFPLNTCVLVRTSDTALRQKLGLTGEIPDALAAISAQLDEDTGAAQVVVVRVAAGATEAETIANVVGVEANRTGMWAFLDAPEILGLTPRLLVTPGFTVRQENGVTTINVSNKGTGYTAAPTVAFSGGGGTGAAGTANLTNGVGPITVGSGGTGYSSAPTVTISAPPAGGVQATATATVSAGAVTAVTVTNPGSGYTTAPTVTFTGAGSGAAATAALTGRVDSVTITNPGSGYTSAPTVSFTGGTGTGAAATATVDQLTNAVCAILPTICDRLKAGTVPDGPTSSRQAAIDWLETLPRSERIFHPLRQKAKVALAEGGTAEKPLSPYIIGLYVKRDGQRDGVPSGSIANQSINGLVGVTPAIPLSITDASSLGQADLALSFGIVCRGEAGVESSLSAGGYTFWGTDTLSEDTNWLFAHAVRTRDYIELGQVKAMRFYLGRFNITVQTVQAIMNTLEEFLSKLRADRHILDYRKYFEPDQNLPTELRLGHLAIAFEAEEPPVLRKLTIHSRRHIQALTNLVRNISVQLGTLA